MRTFVDLRAALLRDKIDRALDSLYLEAPKKESSKSPVHYGHFSNKKSSLNVAV